MKYVKIIWITSIALNAIFILLPVLKFYRSKIAFLGDSITEGLPVKNTITYIVENDGVSGFTTYDLGKYSGKVARGNPDKIFIQIGINDFYYELPIDSVLSNFKKIILNIRANNPKVLIYVSSLFPTGGQFSSLNTTIKAYNSILKVYCLNEGIPYINMYPALLKGGEINEIYSIDGMHLSNPGYQIWIDSLTIYMTR